ncbi:condensation domain-containing protein [Actinoplanes utahensis]|uniref:Condensation domain-containing protein n=1 Tax=Actinoplanes utahensis TaxID=1869 RepID=A0A0A6UQ56_ACTUT|nr:condensation domain-containing protein [Actinoplanes utahensis]KHD78265.1 hypothetical protein MB27_05300 [Actinoplanes utahensis]GIF28860.1 hypothetical protein Aut01nite_18460 [Actinoplanes utahensis]
MDQTLTPHRRTAVRFTGDRHGTAALTWGQREIWELFQKPGARRCHYNYGRVYAVPGGRGVEDVCAALRVLVERYEALRTTVRCAADGEPRQVLAADGELTLEIYEADVRETGSFAEMVRVDYLGHSFGDEDWPLRVAVICGAGKPAFIVLMVSHLAVDRGGLDVVSRALSRLLAGAEPSPAGRHPLDLAADEESPRGRLIAERAAAYWRRTLMATAPMRFPPQRKGSRPGWPAVELESAAMAVAASAIAREQRTSPMAVILAAVAGFLHRWTGNETVVVQLISANRPSAGLRDMVGTTVQRALFAVDCSGTTLHELVRRTWAGMTLANRHGRYPPQMIQAVLDEVEHDRGLGAEVHCFVNNFARFDTAGHADGATPRRLRESAAWPIPRGLSLEIRDSAVGLRLNLITDPRLVAADGARALLCAVEELLTRGVRSDFALDEVAVHAEANEGQG